MDKMKSLLLATAAIGMLNVAALSNRRNYDYSGWTDEPIDKRAADALVLMLQWACDPTKASPGYKPLHEAIERLRTALAAQPVKQSALCPETNEVCSTCPTRGIPCEAAQPAEPVGDVVVSWNEDGQIVAVTRQDDEGRILSVIAESATPPAPAAVPPGYALVPVEPTQEMVDAYLKANATYWTRIDELPTVIGKWRNGSPLEATAYGYRAMIAAAGDKP